MRGKIPFFAALMACGSPAFADGLDPAIDRLINSSGLERLEGQERESARLLVRTLLANRGASSDTLADSAEEYMKNEGYEPVQLQMAQVDGEYYLIARGSILSHATNDIPIGLGRITFKDGEYFAKRNSISGGISEFIDSDGNTQRLMFANWIPLR